MSQAASSQQTLPYSLEAERHVLAGMLHDPEALLTGLELLREPNELWKREFESSTTGRRASSSVPSGFTTLFFHKPHQLLFDIIDEVESAGQRPTFTSLLEQARKKGVLDEIGGVAAITEIFSAAATGTEVRQDAEVVKEKFLLRRLIITANRLESRAYEDREEAETLISEVEESLRSLSDTRHSRSFIRIGEVLEGVQEALREAVSKRGVVTGLPTYFTLLDEKTSGLQKSDLIVLAARPSVGKTAFALNIMMNVATKSNLPVGMFSLEMSITQIVQRLLCLMARVDLKKLRSGHLSRKETSRVFNNLGHLAPLPIYVDDTPGLTITSLRSRAVRLKKREPKLSLLVVDYMQLMEAGGPRMQRNRQEEVAAISRGLKDLARELNVPVLALSQLSRDVEKRGADTPRLSDLRESGAIEQDADVVLFLHRNRPRDSEDPAEEDMTAEVIIGKQRNGPVGTIPVAFIPNYAMFHNLDRQHTDPVPLADSEYDPLTEDFGDEQVGLSDGVPF